MGRIPKLYLNTIRKKMLFYFLVSIFLVGFVSVYLTVNSRNFFNRIDSMFNSSIILEKMQSHLHEAEENLALYIQTKDSDSKNDYQYHSESLTNSTGKLKEITHINSHNIEKLSNLIDTFNKSSKDAINAKLGRDVNTMREKYNEAHQTAKFIEDEIQDLNLEQLKNNTNYYITLSRNILIVQKANLLMIIDIFVLATIIILYITYKMTAPIIKLSHSAEEISKGNFETEEVIVSSEDEIKVMVEAFNKMKSNIRTYIQELHNKAEMESKLMEKEMQNLKMQTLLNNAELRSLQSQINPHFLFNSLNAGVQLAMMEEADNTMRFMENLAAVFRYNVRRLNNVVTLQDEIDSVRAYLDLMKTRFGDMINLEENIRDEEIMKIKMPPLILQPVVENACIHGIREKESGGRITILVYRECRLGIIEIIDNGIGISKEKIKEIYRKAEKGGQEFKKPKRGHTTGIGLYNVIQRLRLYYNKEDIIDISSSEGLGTKFKIKIPFLNMEEKNV